jgi:hypothetical protein
VRKPPSNLPIVSETSALAAAKTGQVLVRTSRHPSVPKIESNQLQKLAMSGALKLSWVLRILLRCRSDETDVGAGQGCVVAIGLRGRHGGELTTDQALAQEG